MTQIKRAKEQRVEAKKRKAKNEEKGNTYQVVGIGQQIKDTKKLKKWSKKARKQLMKMPKDMFEEYLLTTKQKESQANNPTK